MTYSTMSGILSEQTKANYYFASTVINSMTDEEYNSIPVLELTKSQFDFIEMYAVMDIPNRELNNFCDKKTHYRIFYVAPTLFKVKIENK